MSDGFPYADPKHPANFAYKRPADTAPVSEKMLAWIYDQARPVLWSEIQAAFGAWDPTNVAFALLQAEQRIEAVFPESKPYDSGRQFWIVKP